MTALAPPVAEAAAATAPVGEIVLLGSEMILLLLMGYALLEVGAALLRRVRAGTCQPERAKFIFGLCSLVFALSPGVLAGYAVRTKLAGLTLDMFAGVGIVLAAMLIGFFGQLGGLVLFFRKVSAIAKKETAAPEPRMPPSASHTGGQADAAP